MPTKKKRKRNVKKTSKKKKRKVTHNEGKKRRRPRRSAKERDADGNVIEKKIIPGQRNFVYILESSTNPSRTYIGKTTDMFRRIRQHNGELARGGARKTKSNRPWKVAAMITADPSWFTRRRALQLEWSLQKIKRVQRSHYKHIQMTARTQKSQLTESGSKIHVRKHAAISHRLCNLFWLLNYKKKWVSDSVEYETSDAHALTVYLAPPFHTTTTCDALQATQFWSPVVSVIPENLGLEDKQVT